MGKYEQIQKVNKISFSGDYISVGDKMNKRRKQTRPIDPEGHDLFDNEFAVQSMTECTGLIPNAPTDDDDTQAYSEIYDVPLPKIHLDEQ